MRVGYETSEANFEWQSREGGIGEVTVEFVRVDTFRV